MKTSVPAWVATLPSILAMAVNILGNVLDSLADRRLSRYLKERTTLSAEAIAETRYIASDRVLQINSVATLGALILSIWPLRMRVATDELALLAILIALFSAVTWSQVFVADPGSLSADEWRTIGGRRLSRYDLFNAVCLAVNILTLCATGFA